ncbi:MAG: hypothetical protein P1U56_02060 [Saprospiraceae bacterium]|nr:hypothetical protein [Saprospiraceae bacterium]
MRYLLSISLIFFICQAWAQSPYVLPGTLTDEIGDRWDILYDFDHSVFSSQRNISRTEITERAVKSWNNEENSKLDQWDINYILKDNNDFSPLHIEHLIDPRTTNKKVFDSTGVFYYFEGEKKSLTTLPTGKKERSLFGHFYQSEANFFEINQEDFTLRVNPILNLRYGNGVDDPSIVFQNTRGIEIRGLIDQKIYFYSNILENQAHFNNYLEDRIERFQTIGGQGFYKPYKSGLIENLQGHDFLNAQAYFGINATKSLAIEFGHGKHFIGNGIRSLLLSDYSNNYFYLKFNTRIWKFHYQNIFAELAPISANLNPGNRLLPKKYMANHYLSFKATENLEFGIFEAVVFSREDRFEFQYLNPVILYRTVEQFLDSPDNVLIGLNGKWNIKNRFQLYGQLMFDEFNLGKIIEREGWWANKNGIQAGLKYINVGGIDHLDIQVEYNRVRPFTYAHRDTLSIEPRFSTASYSHHSQPLAHPLGANFTELIFHGRYRLGEKIFFNGRIVSAKYGQDLGEDDNGGNILLVTSLRAMENGHSIGQGVETNLLSIGLDVSYQLFHNGFFDLEFLYRKADAELDDLDINTTFVGGGFRMNIGNIISNY